MSVVAARPRTLAEALELRAAHPEWTVVAGGTDVMVAVNDGRRAIDGWLSVRDVADLAGVRRDGDHVVIGAGATFADLRVGATTFLPALAMAARTVGSPQIRTAGTIGGNLVTASPAADSVPPLLCADAEVDLASVRGTRRLPLVELATGPKRTALAADELLTHVRLTSTGGASTFAKVGTRNAMVISVCSIAARLDAAAGVARVAIGSVAPTVRLVPAAADALLDPHGADDLAHAVVNAADPIDDVRATASYRRHALGVLAGRVHAWLWDEVRAGTGERVA